MSISWDARNKRWRFEFKRSIAGRRVRASKLLPQGWSQAKADAFDRSESARLYGIASGIDKPSPLIDTAVEHYLRDKTHLKSHRKALENLAAIAWAYSGKTFDDLPSVAALVCATTEGVREGKVLAPASIKQRLALLKAACRWGWKRHAMGASDPTGRMQMPQVHNERHIYATREEMLRLAKAADRPDVRALIRVAFYTGMRLGEIRRTTVADGALHLDDTKNGERRSIPMHPRIRTCAKYLPLTTIARTLQDGFKRARDRCGLAHMHLHDLRHSAASEMINADVDLYVVGAVLGHKDPRSTARYAHLQHRTLASAVGKIGQKTPHTQKLATG
jgi:integrase